MKNAYKFYTVIFILIFSLISCKKNKIDNTIACFTSLPDTVYTQLNINLETCKKNNGYYHQWYLNDHLIKDGLDSFNCRIQPYKLGLNTMKHIIFTSNGATKDSSVQNFYCKSLTKNYEGLWTIQETLYRTNNDSIKYTFQTTFLTVSNLQNSEYLVVNPIIYYSEDTIMNSSFLRIYKNEDNTFGNEIFVVDLPFPTNVILNSKFTFNDVTHPTSFTGEVFIYFSDINFIKYTGTKL